MDVYVNVDGTTALASTGPVSAGLGAAAELRGLSADGNTIVFATKGKLVPHDLDRDLDVYVRSVAPAATKLISAEAIPPQMRVARRGRLLASGRALVKVACPKAEASGPCHGTVTLTRGKKRVGRAPFRVDAGGRQRVAVRLLRTRSPDGPTMAPRPRPRRRSARQHAGDLPPGPVLTQGRGGTCGSPRP